MTLTSVDKDIEGSLTLIADFAASVERSGSCGPTRAGSSAGGARRPTRRRSWSTTYRRAAA